MTIMGILFLLLASINGYLLAQLFAFLPRSFRLLISPALGFIVTTEIILFVSLIIGFHQPSIWLAAFIVFALSAVVFRYIVKIEKNKAQTTYYLLLTTHFKLYWPLWLLFATLGAFVTYIFFTQVLTPGPNGALMVGGGGLYGDTALHSAYTMSIVEQGLPPQNPLFAGIPLIYPFLVNLFSASLVKLGMSLRWSFVTPQLVYFVAFTTLFYGAAKKLLASQGHSLRSNIAVTFAMLIFFLGSGLGFTRYIQDSKTSGNWLITREYTNNLDNFHFHNVLTGLIFPERSFLPGLVIGLLITSIALNLIYNKKLITHNSPLITIGILLGILPLWHMHTFLFFGVAVGVWLLTHPNPLFDKREGIPPLLSKGRLGGVIIVYLIALLLSLPIFFWFSQQVSHESFIKFSTGWMNQGKDFFSFWWQNSGLLFPLSLLGFYFLPKKHKLFFIPVFVLFVIANTVVFQPWDWDNIKLFSWILLFSSILVGHTLTQLWQTRLLRPILIIIFVSLIATGSLSLIHAAPQQYTLYDTQDISLAEWIKTNTKPEDIFLIDPYATHPVPGLSGRSVYVGYPGHLWVHGIKYGEREQFVKQFLTGQIEQIQQSEIPIDFIVTPTHFSPLPSQTTLALAFQNQKFKIWRVN